MAPEGDEAVVYLINSENFSAGAGNAPTSTASTWVSYTFKAPAARKAMDGSRPLIVKVLTFKVCGKTVNRKIFARASTASGARFENSTTQTISWQHGATSTYYFSGLNFHFNPDRDGSNIRVWLVSGGAFYFNRNTGAPGHMVSNSGASFSGAPVGTIKYSEVASAPSGLTVTRDATTGTTLHLSWKRESDDGGAGRMGYRLQLAQDPGFTQGLRNLYVSKETTTQYGFTRKTSWYVRVATRNEVSEYYKLPGGVWSNVATVGSVAIGSGDPTPAPDDVGTPSGSGGDPGSGGGGSSGGGTGGTGGTTAPQHKTYIDSNTPSTAEATLTPGSTGSVMQAVARLPETGEWFSTQVITESNDDETVRLSRMKDDGSFVDQMILSRAGHGTAFEVTREGGVTTIWLTWRKSTATGPVQNDVVRFPYRAGTYTRAQVTGLKVINAGGGTYRLVGFDSQNGLAVVRVVGNGKETYTQHRLTAVRAGDFSSPLHSLTLDVSGSFGLDDKPTMQGFATYKTSFFRYTGAPSDVAGGDPVTLTEYDWADGTAVKTLDLSTMAKVSGAYPGGRGEPEGLSIYAADATQPNLYLGFSTGPVGGPHGYEVF